VTPEHLVRALDGFEKVLAGVAPGDWDAPSPCEGWSAVEVAGHVVLDLRGIQSLATGVPAPENKTGLRSAAGADPLVTWRATRADLVSALDAQAQSRTITLPWGGEMPLSEFVERYPLEIVVHTWDLAQATGQSFEANPELVRGALATAGQFASAGRQAGLIGPARAVADDADDLTRLLAVFGRAV
jgi:uncharacterized protein (TIGR03086 family)